MKNLYNYLRKADKNQKSYLKFLLSGVGLIAVGLAVALAGNNVPGIAGKIILLAGLLLAAIGATIAAPYGW